MIIAHSRFPINLLWDRGWARAMKNCPLCNAILHDNADMCNFCWEKVPEAAPEYIPKKKPIKKSTLLIFALLLGSGVWWWATNRDFFRAEPVQASQAKPHIRIKEFSPNLQEPQEQAPAPEPAPTPAPETAQN